MPESPQNVTQVRDGINNRISWDMAKAMCSNDFNLFNKNIPVFVIHVIFLYRNLLINFHKKKCNYFGYILKFV